MMAEATAVDQLLHSGCSSDQLLSRVARNCDVDTLRLLLEGVGVDQVCKYGVGIDDSLITPLQHVCKSNKSRNQIGRRVACVELLIERGACVDAGAPGNPGQSTDTHTNLTPLMYAVGGGYLDIVKMLLSAGADVNVLCNSSRGPRYSPLIMAMISYQAAKCSQGRRDPKECDAIVETLLAT